MVGPPNLRVYGVLIRADRVLVAVERVGGRDVLKFPGGGVDPEESPETALRREFHEESGLTIDVRRLLHAPGTLYSPWTLANYTPLYYLVAADGEPAVPPGEAIELRFMVPEAAIASGRMARPEIFALRRALAR